MGVMGGGCKGREEWVCAVGGEDRSLRGAYIPREDSTKVVWVVFPLNLMLGNALLR